MRNGHTSVKRKLIEKLHAVISLNSALLLLLPLPLPLPLPLLFIKQCLTCLIDVFLPL
jgi:hypothetical protein